MAQLSLPLPKPPVLITSADYTRGFRDGFARRGMAEGIQPQSENGVQYMRGYKAGMLSRGGKNEEIIEAYAAVRAEGCRPTEG
jgi:hypothetical protein